MPRKTRLIEPRKYGANKKAKGVTMQQELFVQELVADPLMSPKRAAINAGYKDTNAAVQANALLKHPVIQQMVGKALSDRLNRTKIEQDDVIRFLYNALMLDPLELFDSEDGTLTMKQLHEIPVEIRRLITKIEATTRQIEEEVSETRIKIEWVSKELALQLCMRHLGLLGDTTQKIGVEVNVNQQLVMQLRQAVEEKSRVIDSDAIARMAKG